MTLGVVLKYEVGPALSKECYSPCIHLLING